MILWKVVRGEDRVSSAVFEVRYQRTYLIGKIVEAVPGSLGLFCFRRKRDAKAYRGPVIALQIIKVQPVDCKVRAAKNIGVSMGIRTAALNRYYTDKHKDTIPAPKGTVLVRKVRVLT